jgi:carboxymethylenebutenolidase
MGEMIQVLRPDGKTCPGYLAKPTGSQKALGDKAPAVVVIQEWWGLNDQIKKVADRYAQAGYRALVPDLYRGKVASKMDEANHLMTGLNFPDAGKQDVRGCVQHLKAGGGKVGVLGFCMGGALTIIAGVHVPEADVGVCFYGIPPKEAADPAQLRVPFQGHFANKDDWCTPAAVNGLEAALKGAGKKFEIYRYDAQHAFMNEARPEVYDAACAKLAWDRNMAFLKTHLGG